MIFTSSLLGDLTGIIIALGVITVAYFKWSYQYWKRRNLPYLEPTIPFGNLGNPLTRNVHIGLHLSKFYTEIKQKGLKHSGIYFLTRPVYYVVDLDYLKNILTKDFQHFVDRGFYYNEKDDPISAHLFALSGVKWRNLRAKLSPTFTSGKMKTMFHTLVDCSDLLQEVMDKEYENRAPVDIKEMLARFTTNVIGSCAFGLDCNTFKEEDSPFRKFGTKFFNPSKIQNFKIWFATGFPSMSRYLGLKTVPSDVSDFYHKIVKNTVEYREKNGVERKDFMQMLIELKNNKLVEENGYKHDGKSLTIDEMVAQSFVFFLAGFETSSTTSTFVLYELARNQDIQQKVRNEINTVLAKHDGKITYDSINDMKYMNQVIDETLRIYPPVTFITRECVKDYKIPDHNVVIEKGTLVMVPIYGIHHDKELYADPEKFDPERFNEENKKNRHQYAHIPFGEGPRICIGMRFGLMQTKVSLATLLKNYQVTINSRTKQPLSFDAQTIVLSTDSVIWLDAKSI